MFHLALCKIKQATTNIKGDNNNIFESKIEYMIGGYRRSLINTMMDRNKNFETQLISCFEFFIFIFYEVLRSLIFGTKKEGKC